VTKVLSDLGVDPADSHRVIEVWNKIDRLDAESRLRIENIAARKPADTRPILLSALTGEGTDAFLAAIEARISVGKPTLSLSIDPADGAGLGWLHRQCEVLERRLDEHGRMAVTVRVDLDKVEQVRRKFPSAA